MLRIKKDVTGKTYEYILTYDDKEILQSDGVESVEEIERFFKELIYGYLEGTDIN